MSDTHEAQTVIDALRLAYEASADNNAFTRIANYLLGTAPETETTATAPVALLIDAIRDSGCELSVQDDDE